MINEDLWNSYRQFDLQIKSQFHRIPYYQKILLSLILFALLPSVFFSKKSSHPNKKAILHYGNTEAWNTIYAAVDAEQYDYKIIRKLIPIIPKLFIHDLLDAFKYDWRFVLKHLYFFGFMALRVGQYYRFIQNRNLGILIVMQEYSPYMRYLTRVLESENKKLFNIMHGIPGKESSYFRFTRCFVWGEYFKNYYIHNHAHPDQFVISGSPYHQMLKQNRCIADEDIDILYMMQGEKHVSNDEITDTFDVLKNFVTEYRVVCKQHPVYPVKHVPEWIELVDEAPGKLLCRSKIILSHHSTALLDAMVLNKQVIAFTKVDRKEILHFLPSKAILTTKENLNEYLSKILIRDTDIAPLNCAIDDVNVKSVFAAYLGG